MTGPRSRLAIVLSVACLLGGLAGADVATAHTLSKGKAQRAAFKVAKKAAIDSGAVMWWAGKCKRRSAHRVVCWGAVVYANYEGCAQKIVVTLSSRIRARRSGRTYCGDLSEEAQQNSGSSSGEWAVCGIRSSVCIGS